MSQARDLTLDEVFADPMIQLMMKADKVDPAALRRTWETHALPRRVETVPHQAAGRPVPAGWDALVALCACSGSERAPKTPTRVGLC